MATNLRSTCGCRRRAPEYRLQRIPGATPQVRQGTQDIWFAVRCFFIVTGCNNRPSQDNAILKQPLHTQQVFLYVSETRLNSLAEVKTKRNTEKSPAGKTANNGLPFLANSRVRRRSSSRRVCIRGACQGCSGRGEALIAGFAVDRSARRSRNANRGKDASGWWLAQSPATRAH